MKTQKPEKIEFVRCSKCKSVNTSEKVEVREGGYFEVIFYCKNCGTTQS